MAIVDEIRKKTGLTKRDVTRIVDSFFHTIKEGLANHEHIEIRGFGTFSMKKRNARIARNPKTNQIINVPEHYRPYFKAGKSLKSRCH